MVRRGFYVFAVLAPLLTAAWALIWPPAWWLLALVIALVAVGNYDIYSRHNVLYNYPVIGHLRYLLEFVRPELRQYFFESETSGRPFDREQRDIVDARADGRPDTAAFGTVQELESSGFEFARHSLAVKEVDSAAERVTFGGPQCQHPYLASRLNISAMSFGSLSANAIRALNRGAALGGFAHNTGEGGLSPYHLEYGADVIWELGTAYFGCRTKNGRFDAGEFAEKAAHDQVKMIEIKLSQGAKPSHGGLLPAAKITEEIARIRDIDMGVDCLSPPTHTEFDSPIGLLQFVARVRELAGGKPVGFKLCLGRRDEFLGICKAMHESGIRPDFITVDGAEGGTGAAPIEFSDRLGSYINDALPFVHNALVGSGVRDDLRIIASGKVAMGFDMVIKHALGANACNAARPFMFAIGCIQARRCHTNKCPTGITTMDPHRTRAVDVMAKGERVRNFHRGTLDTFLSLTGALGCSHPDQLSPELIYRRAPDGAARSCAEIYPLVQPGQFLGGEVPPEYAHDWQSASADRF
ncbi:FMN-binding glutamate synthase family protein [Microbulbifer sp. SAOS-129_SWC]|uniref:FMN-binding glutamate synthase family protein n=1 Tax=Microbulbifer sp. SAOS-129_SWC TaxID=3145235 RepID=UPI0032172A2E